MFTGIIEEVAEVIKIEKEDRRNTLLKTIPPAKRPLYTVRDFNTSFPQNY